MFVLAFAAALVAGCLLTAWVLPSFGPHAVIGGYAALFVPYVLILRELGHGGYSAHSYPQRMTAAFVIAAAVLARLVLLPAEPLLSDDLYRYVWEGRVVLAGFNPFVLPPEAAELTSLRDAHIWPLINHPEVPTIYPPVSQGFFALSALLGGGLGLIKLLFVLFEAAMVGVVWRVCRDRFDTSRLVMALAIYALNPLVILEVAWSGHLDVLAWGSLVAALVVWQVDSELRWKTVLATGVLIGVSIASKLLGVLALPFLLTGRFRGRETGWLPHKLGHRLAAIAVALLVVMASYVPFADAGRQLFGGFGTYAAAWRSNEGGYRAISHATQWGLERLASDQDRATPGDRSSDVIFRFPQWDETFMELGWTKEWKGQTLPNTSFTSYSVAQTTAKALVAFLCALVLLWLVLGRWQPLAATGSLLLVLYFFAPTVHPWYVAWLVPFAALRPRAAPLVFSGLVLLGYYAWVSAATGGRWYVPWWVVLIEFGVIAAIVLLPNNRAVIVEELDTFLP